MAKMFAASLAAVLLVLPLVAAQTPSTVFAVMGDWGWGPDGDYTFASVTDEQISKPAQKAVATAMGIECQKFFCNFLINNGDNFYNLGIRKDLGVFDPQWTTSFNNIYNAASLRRIKFYGVLGNHDYGKTGVYNHSIWPQIEYTAYDPLIRWYIPQRYYSSFATSSRDRIVITTVDTSPFINSYCTKPTNTYHTDELVLHCTDPYRKGDENHMKNYLNYARKVPGAWSIAVGHHPLISAPSGPLEPLNSVYAPILNAGQPHLWFNGHDHFLGAWKHPNVTGTQFFTIGASGIADPSDLPAPPQDTLFSYSSGNHGFGIVKLYSDYGTLTFYEVTDFSDPLKPVYGPTHTTTFQKF